MLGWIIAAPSFGQLAAPPNAHAQVDPVAASPTATPTPGPASGDASAGASVGLFDAVTASGSSTAPRSPGQVQPIGAAPAPADEAQPVAVAPAPTQQTQPVEGAVAPEGQVQAVEAAPTANGQVEPAEQIQPVEQAPSEAPAEQVPAEQVPAEAPAADVQAVETAPAEDVAPVEAAAAEDVAPVEAAAADIAPVEAQPAEAQPAMDEAALEAAAAEDVAAVEAAAPEGVETQEVPAENVAPAAVEPAHPAEGNGAISGNVIDADTAEAVIDAGVEVVGTTKKARTDIDGHYRFELPPGTYQVRFFAAGYQSARIETVNVKLGESTTADISLQIASTDEVDVVEVVAEAAKASAQTQIVERQKADSVQDTIGAEEFKKAPDSSAAEVVERVPSVTIRNDYVFIRGLGERYSSALLNSSRLPSTNPDKRVVPLDIFPAQLIDSIAIIKSFTPNLPGDFSGGIVDINLRSFPPEAQITTGAGMGFNTNTTFNKFRSYRKARTFPNLLGIDTDRELPSIFGTERINTGDAQMQATLVGALQNIWSPKTMTAPPNSSITVSAGNDWGDLGGNFAASWSNAYESSPSRIERVFENAGSREEPVQQELESFDYEFSTYYTNLNAVGTLSYDIGADNRLTLRGLYTRQSEDLVQVGSGFRDANDSITQNVTRLEYTQEDLAFGQLTGKHAFPRGPVLPSGSELSWRTAYAHSTKNRPDTRTFVYNSPPDPPTISLTGGSTSRIWYDLTEQMTDSAVDMAIPLRLPMPWVKSADLEPTRLTFGPAYTFRDRESNLRRFIYQRGPNFMPDLGTLPPEELLNRNIVGDGIISFIESTQARDSFTANEEIAGAYAMAEVPLLPDQLRFVGGVRVEYSKIDLKFGDIQGTEGTRRLINTNPLPSVGLIWTPLNDMNVRVGWAETVSRPEFRELSPILFPEPLGEASYLGNPDLEQATIDSVDLRWEWFFAPLELVSVSGFYKDLKDPIEQTYLNRPGVNVYSWDNSKEATLAGFEFEARKNFGFLRPELQKLSLQTNVAYIYSKSERGQTDPSEVPTETTHALQGQAPFIVNAALEYDDDVWGTTRLLYNTAGESIFALGYNGLDNILEERRDQLDFVYSQELTPFGRPVGFKFSVENMLNDSYLRTQGGEVQQRYRLGVTFGISASYEF